MKMYFCFVHLYLCNTAVYAEQNSVNGSRNVSEEMGESCTVAKICVLHCIVIN
jgi:hypothetical protein